ncbi:unannotated protein [freshwater metagenome]|uniref:Unannotated protein n=1 Tax=freshwater metagenome TaxID=449393 RepID=A0A6J6AXF2_9ZZZZ|nr:methyltransferase domain-containing protein [Actinomycetota bacterium]
MQQTLGMDQPSAAEEFWSQDSQVEAFSKNSDVLLYESDLIAEAIAAASTTGEVKEVHAVGVGTGRELPAVRALLPEAKISAWDVSEPMVQACSAFVQDQGLTNISVGQADIVDLSSHGTNADLVVLLNAILCYVNTPQDRRRALLALHGLLRSGGTIAVVVHQPNSRPDWAMWFGFRSLLCRLSLAEGSSGDRRISHGDSTMSFHHFRPTELRRLLTESGFEHIRIRSLRTWSRETGHRIPWRSPNPLMVTAVRSQR